MSITLKPFDPVGIPVICIIGASQSIENLPIQQWREIRPIEGARPFDRYCAAQVNGDSLKDDGIYDGDFVIIRLNFEAYEIKPGRLVATLTPYGLLLKHIYLTLNNQVRLVSANPNYEDLLLDLEDVQIQGVIVRIERDM